MKNFLTLMVTLIVFGSCQLDDNVSLLDSDQNQAMLHFKTDEEVAVYYNQVKDLSEQELAAFEKERGFISLQRKSNDVMEDLSEREFSSYADIEKYIQQNCDFIQIIEVAGEKRIVRLHEETPAHFIANARGIFQIKNKGYKVFNEGLVSIPKSRMEDFQNTNTFEEAVLNGFDVAYENKLQSSSVLVESGCPDNLRDKKTNDNNRTFTEIQTKLQIELFPFKQKSIVQTHVYTEFKIFGIWKPVKRSITGYFKYVVWSRVNLGSKTIITGEVQRLIPVKDYRWVHQAILNSTTNESIYLDSGLDNYWGWGDSPSTSTGYVICNSMEICASPSCPGPFGDPCDYTTCPSGYTCDAGVCIPPEVPDPCENVQCSSGFRCENGYCVENFNTCGGSICLGECINGECAPIQQ